MEAESWDEATLASLDEATDAAIAMRPGEVPIYLSFDVELSRVNVRIQIAEDVAHPLDKQPQVLNEGLVDIKA